MSLKNNEGVCVVVKVREIIGNYSKWIPSQNYNTAKPEVSVLLPTFRRAKSGLFEAAVQSVLNQDFKNLELIIIDDASTDGTADLISHFMQNDPRVSCIRHERNIGLPAISEYEGYMKARGAYIAFIFDDNEWERDHISRTIAFMVRKNAKMAYGRIRSYYGDGTQYIELGQSTIEIGTNTLPATNHIANGGVIVSRDAIEAVGLYDPHVAMTRLCDWNMWQRLAVKYELFETGILAGSEKGVMLSDSLGNSYKMNSWITAERKAFQNTEELLPKNYLDIEINEITADNTESYLEAIDTFYRHFSEKDWYREESKNLHSSNRAVRVLVISMVYDASIELIFGRLAQKRPNLVFKFLRYDVPVYEIIQSDVVILARNLVCLNRFKNICKGLHVPCYYYTDDNFLALYRDIPDDSEIQALASYWNITNIRDFSGVLVSTQGLRDFFLKERLHNHVLCVEPVLQLPEETDNKLFSQQEEETVCAYLGSPFRDKIFTKVVLPALVAVAQDTAIHLVCPERVKISKGYEGIPNFRITKIPYSLSLDETLKRYRVYHPNYLLHCGPEVKNNIYKTENALLNAVSLGAVLVASRTEQYQKAEESGYCLCFENTPDKWRDGLKELVETPGKANQIYRSAKSYCSSRYTSQAVIATLETEFKPYSRRNGFEIVERYNAALFDLIYNGSAILSGTSEGDENSLPAASKSRSLQEVPLVYSGGIEHTRTYYIICSVSTLSRLGICFASLGMPSGQVKVKLCTQNQVLREAILDFYDYVRDGWTYLSFEPIENALNMEMIVLLEFEYGPDSDLVGVFEDGTKRSLLYRIFNKLGHPLPVKNLLYVDCK